MANNGNATAAAGAIVPAQVGFLAIFNPCLGNTDDTINDQIVYYASDTTQREGKKKRRTRGRPTDAISQEERNERLRQIGLAQGIINFSRGFADGGSLDSVDTEKSRVVTHELEPGWWLLASINFTKVPLPPRLPVKTVEEQEEKYEFSSRELKPAALLLQDLLRAHSIFLMHHDTSLSALYVRKRRSKFVSAITRYWDLFLSTWNVMLHGNPVRSIFGGINVAISGELGVGVGEEQRGSGEREVLEGLVGRIEGLVDLVVSKFGTDEETDDALRPHRDKAGSSPRWLGTGKEPAAEDGVIFLGVGALSRKSLRDVAHWMEDLYQWGDHAYGVIESPTSTRKGRGRRPNKSVDETPSATATPKAEDKASEPSETLLKDKIETERHAEEPQQQPEAARVEQDSGPLPTAAQADSPTNVETSGGAGTTGVQDGKLDKMLGYMKLGYGSYWTMPGISQPSTSNTNTASTPRPSSTTSISTTKSKPSQEATSSPRSQGPGTHLPRRNSSESRGHYLIGLKGPIDEDARSDSSTSSSGANVRTVLRTVNVELEHKPSTWSDAAMVHDFQHWADSGLTQHQVASDKMLIHDVNKSEKLRAVVYANRPFIFTFLFHLHTDSLAWHPLYRSLHYQLSPLRKPLLASTAYRPHAAGSQPTSSSPASAGAHSIYSLVWDPRAMTVHSTIPSIPTSAASAAWSRADALSSHLHLLAVHALTRRKHADLERSQKTNRGWWIVWTRLLDRTAVSPQHGREERHSGQDEAPGAATDEVEENATSGGEDETTAQDQHRVTKEILLLRRASDHAGFRGITAGDVRDGAGGATRLVQGIGVDTTRYVEELLSFL